MLFRQRIEPDFWKKLRLWLWPRHSFSRSLRYMGKRLLRIPASPHIIALGLAIGVFFAATPLYGFHILFAMLFAWLFSANIAAAALGTAFANPFTIPFILSAAYEMGRAVLPLAHKTVALPVLVSELHDADFKGIAPALFQLSIGSALIGFILAAAAYAGAYYMVAHFQAARKKRFAARQRGNAGGGNISAAHRGGAKAAVGHKIPSRCAS